MSDDEFLEFWGTVKWPDVIPVYLRLYHDDQGRALFYSQESVPGKYVEVTPEQFALQDLRVRVVGGQLIPRAVPAAPKLVPSNTGTACAPNDVSIVVGQQQPNQPWKLKHHDAD